MSGNGGITVESTTPLLVMKFGGTSVGNAEALQRAVEIVCSRRRQWAGCAVVVSALSGVTDLLLASAASAACEGPECIHEAADQLTQRHLEIVQSLVAGAPERGWIEAQVRELVATFINLCSAVSVLGEATPRALDAIASLGERLSSRVVTACLRERGEKADFVEATRLLVTDSRYQSAHPDLKQTTRRCREVLGPLLQEGTIPVITGFIGATAEGVTTTLGRGGSDYSAAIIGAALEAAEVWIWTDVDGVMTADPRLVPKARTVGTLSYRELAELAYFGAKVLHPKTIRPVIEAGVGLRVRNTFNPQNPGTNLVSRHSAATARVIKAVTAIEGQRLITIEGRGMLGVPGVAARAFGAVAATGTNVILISQASSEQTISFAVSSESAPRVIQALETTFATELANRDIDRIWGSPEAVIITVVGAGMRHTPGIAGKVFSALGSHKVNVVAIAQGSSEVSISMVVDSADVKKAVQAVHSLIDAPE